MKTSLIEIREIEKYLSGTLNEAELRVFQARLRNDVALRLRVRLQRHVMLLLKAYHRKMLRRKTSEIHQRLFQDPAKRDFQQEIASHFNS